jgi:hypothetical protein
MSSTGHWHRSFAVGVFCSLTFSAADAQTTQHTFERTALSDERTIVGLHYSLTPDCKPSGTVIVRILKQPSHGTLEVEAGKGFPNYKADNVRSRCNTQEVEVTRVWYKASADFKGRDQVQTETFYSSSGSSQKTTTQITVK